MLCWWPFGHMLCPKLFPIFVAPILVMVSVCSTFNFVKAINSPVWFGSANKNGSWIWDDNFPLFGSSHSFPWSCQIVSSTLAVWFWGVVGEKSFIASRTICPHWQIIITTKKVHNASGLVVCWNNQFQTIIWVLLSRQAILIFAAFMQWLIHIGVSVLNALQQLQLQAFSSLDTPTVGEWGVQTSKSVLMAKHGWRLLPSAVVLCHFNNWFFGIFLWAMVMLPCWGQAITSKCKNHSGCPLTIGLSLQNAWGAFHLSLRKWQDHCAPQLCGMICSPWLCHLTIPTNQAFLLLHCSHHHCASCWANEANWEHDPQSHCSSDCLFCHCHVSWWITAKDETACRIQVWCLHMQHNACDPDFNVDRFIAVFKLTFAQFANHFCQTLHL